MDFLSAIPVKTLHSLRNPEYNAEQLRKVADFFLGGSRFEGVKGEYLYRRMIETALSSEFEERVRRANYTNHLAPIIRWWAEAGVYDPARFDDGTFDETTKRFTTPEAAKVGESLTNLAYLLTLYALRDGWAWVRVKYETDDGEPWLEILPAEAVDDWDGGGSYVRLYSEDKEKRDAFTPAVKIQRWTYVTEDETVIYEYRCTSESTTTEPVAVLAERTPHPVLGVLPYKMFRLPESFDLGNVLINPTQALFNLEANLEWLLAKQAFSVLVLKTDLKADKVVISEQSALSVGASGDAKYIAPDAQLPGQLALQIERRRAALYQLAEQSALLVTGKYGNASAASKRRDYHSLDVSLTFLTRRVRNMMNDGFDMLTEVTHKKYPEVIGMETFNLSTPEEEEADDDKEQKVSQTGSQDEPKQKED